MDLKAFGETLRHLRQGAGLTQADLAKEVAVSSQLLSIWERAYRHGERTWVPDRSSVVRLISIFARQLKPEEAQGWAIQAGYDLDDTELLALFPQAILQTPPQPDRHAAQQRLDQLPDQELFGIAAVRAKLAALLHKAGRPWVIALDGMGGIGKSTLAHALAQDALAGRRFHDIAWVSAKQEEFLPEGVLRPIIQPALSAETLVDTLLTQLDPSLGLTRPPEEKLATLTRWLKNNPYLIVVDNLETAVDSESLVPLLQRLTNPSKFLLTTRYSLRSKGSGLHSHTLRGLSEEDTAAFLRHEAEGRDLPSLAQASPAQLSRIYQVVGGNPLALKLVVGQVCVLPLPQVLDSLRQASGQTAEDLYTYIYWQGWEILSPAAKQVLVAMPLAHEGTFADVMRESELDATAVGQALQELTRVSLVEVSGDLETPRYYIHRLTETFLLNEVIKWQAM